MAAFLTRRRKRFTPFSPLPVDWSNPLAKKLAFFTYPGSGGIAGGIGFGQGVDMVSGATAGIAASGTSISCAVAPLTWLVGSSAGNGVRFNTSLGLTYGSQFTIVVRANPSPSSHIRVLFGAYLSGQPTMVLAANADPTDFFSETVHTGRLAVVARDDGLVQRVITQSNSLVDGNMHTYGVTVVADGVTNCPYYVDGVSTVSTQCGAPSTTFFSSSQNVSLGDIGNFNGDANFELGGHIEFAAVWQRALDPGEHEAFSDDPWQVLVSPRPRRVYFGVSSAYTLKTVNGLASTNIKTIQKLARASVKTYDGLTPP